jgi:hypothetical protein
MQRHGQCVFRFLMDGQGEVVLVNLAICVAVLAWGNRDVGCHGLRLQVQGLSSNALNLSVIK